MSGQKKSHTKKDIFSTELQSVDVATGLCAEKR